MGIEHEAIHLETSSVLFRETPVHLMQAGGPVKDCKLSWNSSPARDLTFGSFTRNIESCTSCRLLQVSPVILKLSQHVASL